jgi:hypothetical protein
LVGLEDRGLVYATGREELKVHVCDPFTGEPLHTWDGDAENDPANYTTTNEKGVSQRLIINWTPEGLEQLVRSLVPDGEAIASQGNGDLMIRCPFHDDSKPSCSVSPRKRCFYCFGCKASGGFTKLIGKMTGESKAGTIQRIAAAMGQTAEYRDPDWKASAIYDYLDSKGNLRKQVLRYPNDEQGNKVIRQRRPVADGPWAWNTKGLPPLLYHAELLEYAATICIVEGEKDADSLTKQEFRSDRGGSIIAVTSGGANSWEASLAKQLRNVYGRIVLIPDDDAAGEAYANDVAASLDAEGIPYRTVSLAETGCKDVTEFLEANSGEELERMINDSWEEPTTSLPDFGVGGELFAEITL